MYNYVQYIGEGLAVGNLCIDHGRVFKICNRRPIRPFPGSYEYDLGFMVAPGITQTFSIEDIDKRPDEFVPYPCEEPLEKRPTSAETKHDTPCSSLTFDEAVNRACGEPTLADALTWIAVWETERVVKQAKRFFETGISTASHGGGWDTCFGPFFKAVLGKYPKDKEASKKNVVESIHMEVKFIQGVEHNLDAVLRTPQALENLQRCATRLQKLTSDLKQMGSSETA